MFQVIVVHGRIFFIKFDLMDEFAVMLYIMTGFPSVISKWGVCRADKHSLYKPASNQKWEAFYFYFFYWICWNQNQGCVSVCVCVWALQPRRLCRFWWNFAQMVQQIFANCGLFFAVFENLNLMISWWPFCTFTMGHSSHLTAMNMRCENCIT